MLFNIALFVLTIAIFATQSETGVVITSNKKLMPSIYHLTSTAASPYYSHNSKTPSAYYASNRKYPDVYDAYKSNDKYHDNPSYNKPVKRIVAYNSQSPYVYTTKPSSVIEETHKQRYYNTYRDYPYEQSYVTKVPVYETEAGDYFAPYSTTSSWYTSVDNYENPLYYTTEPYQAPVYTSSDAAAYESNLYSTYTTPYPVNY